MSVGQCTAVDQSSHLSHSQLALLRQTMMFPIDHEKDKKKLITGKWLKINVLEIVVKPIIQLKAMY